MESSDILVTKNESKNKNLGKHDKKSVWKIRIFFKL